MPFEFYYKINDDITWDKDIEYDINRMKHKEERYFNEYRKTLDKSKIPSGTYCNNENMCCPYCVCDRCLLYGAHMESKIGYYGFSFQKRKKRCSEDYPKGKNVAQRCFDLEGAVNNG